MKLTRAEMAREMMSIWRELDKVDRNGAELEELLSLKSRCADLIQKIDRDVFGMSLWLTERKIEQLANRIESFKK